MISSSWRGVFTAEEIVDGLRGHGFDGQVIGVTPWLGPPRGNEIQQWLTDHGHGADSIVILDDNSDMVHLTPRLVLTGWGISNV